MDLAKLRKKLKAEKEAKEGKRIEETALPESVAPASTKAEEDAVWTPPPATPAEESEPFEEPLEQSETVEEPPPTLEEDLLSEVFDSEEEKRLEELALLEEQAEAEAKSDKAASPTESQAIETMPLDEVIHASSDTEQLIADKSDQTLDENVTIFSDDIVELLTFKLGTEDYAFRVPDIEEILRTQRITTVPKVEEFIVGITSLRGKIIPVVDLKGRFYLKGGEQNDKAKILILRGPRGSIGVLVDKVINVIRIPSSGIVDPPTHLTETELKFIEGVAVADNRFISVVRVSEALNFKIFGGGA